MNYTAETTTLLPFETISRVYLMNLSQWLKSVKSRFNNAVLYMSVDYSTSRCVVKAYIHMLGWKPNVTYIMLMIICNFNVYRGSACAVLVFKSFLSGSWKCCERVVALNLANKKADHPKMPGKSKHTYFSLILG